MAPTTTTPDPAAPPLAVHDIVGTDFQPGKDGQPVAVGWPTEYPTGPPDSLAVVISCDAGRDVSVTRSGVIAQAGDSRTVFFTDDNFYLVLDGVATTGHVNQRLGAGAHIGVVSTPPLRVEVHRALSPDWAAEGDKGNPETAVDPDPFLDLVAQAPEKPVAALAAPDEESATEAPSEAQGQPAPGDGPLATDSAKLHAEATGVDLSKVEGTGKDGKITQPDVAKAAAAILTGQAGPANDLGADPAITPPPAGWNAPE